MLINLNLNVDRKSKILLAVGGVFAFFVALPLFLYAVLSPSGTFEIRNRAQETQTPLNLLYTFDNTEAINDSVWGWSGIVGTTVIVEGGELKTVIPAGQVQPSNTVAMYPRINCQNIYTITDFDLRVDMLGANSDTSGQGTSSQTLTFGGDTGFGIRRSKNGFTETLVALRTNGSTLSTVIANYTLPTNTGPIRVRLARQGNIINFDYTLDRNNETYTTLVNLDATTVSPSLPTDGSFYLTANNESPDYPQVTAFFDRFTADLSTYSLAGTACSTSTPSPSPTPTESPTLPPTPTPTGQACNQADINQDGIVDITDYSIFVSDFFKSPPTNPRSDMNSDGIVDITDYSILVSNFFTQTGACQ